jgi:hypothetical protein
VAGSPQAGHSYGVGPEGFTPNVTVVYGAAGEDPALWTTGYGNLTNIHFNDADGDTTFTITFAADAGFNVQLHEFDLASFLDNGQRIQGFTVLNSGGTAVFTQGPTDISGSTHNNFDIGVSDTRLQLVIDLSGLGPVSDDIGIDNIRFGQTAVPTSPVPEPGALLLIGMAAAMTLGRLRRSRRG